MQLRGYQNDNVTGIDAAWAAGHRNVTTVLPTGGGKTRVMGFMAKRHEAIGGYGIAMAHRSVLVGQLSMALAEMGIQHDIIAQAKVVKNIVSEQMDTLGRSYFNPGARWKVASVDTMPGRAAALTPWINRVDLGFTDESHHVLVDNKWGKECLRFSNPNMRWLLPTAETERADGQGLGRLAKGISDVIVEGPSPRELIDQGYLTDFLIRAPMPADLDLSGVSIGANGEYNLQQLRKAVHRSNKIIGNVVDTYKKHTPGMLGICFAVDIEHAKAITAEFNAKGVPAELVTSDHDEAQRAAILKRYRSRATLVLVNVDLFGEGFDLPAIEVVIMARPTASYQLYKQQFGRGLRLGVSKAHIEAWETYTVLQRLTLIKTSGKPIAYVHDHVGNVIHFNGAPDKYKEQSLESRRASRGPSDAVAIRVCLNPECLQPFERFYSACPYCGFEVPAPAAPTLPLEVDGDLTLYTPEMLQRLFGVATPAHALLLQPSTFLKIPPNMANMGAVRALQANHNRKIIEQHKLAQLMPLVMPPTMPTRDAQRRFFHHYGVDVVQARLLGGVETEALVDRITKRLTK